MREPYEIIIAPVVTEKTAGQMEGSTYSFVVAKDANKIEIGHAVEKLWDVTVKDVSTTLAATVSRVAALEAAQASAPKRGARSAASTTPGDDS